MIENGIAHTFNVAPGSACEGLTIVRLRIYTFVVWYYVYEYTLYIMFVNRKIRLIELCVWVYNINSD